MGNLCRQMRCISAARQLCIPLAVYCHARRCRSSYERAERLSLTKPRAANSVCFGHRPNLLKFNNTYTGELCNGSTTDSDSVCWGSNPYSPAKKSSFFGTRIFLSKPQAWHIIRRKSVYHQGRRAARAYHHASACIFLRLDEIQCFALMIYRNKLRMIYTACAVIWTRNG